MPREWRPDALKKHIDINFYLGPRLACSWPNSAKMTGSACFNIPPQPGGDPRPKLHIKLSFKIDDTEPFVYRMLTCIETAQEIPSGARFIASVFATSTQTFHIYELVGVEVPQDVIDQIEVGQAAYDQKLSLESMGLVKATAIN
jgi:hypothetical protein